ncbi:MAG: hypothetical protein F6K24_29725 [Okeania sp. SIO2D1]|nr:hypothetical protein [Okeania sp. SIO2D1]
MFEFSFHRSQETGVFLRSQETGDRRQESVVGANSRLPVQELELCFLVGTV